MGGIFILKLLEFAELLSIKVTSLRLREGQGELSKLVFSSKKVSLKTILFSVALKQVPR